MSLITTLTGLSIGLFAVVLTALAWQIRSGQCDDLEGPSWRALTDDEPVRDEEARP